jgi:hypothetical protein
MSAMLVELTIRRTWPKAVSRSPADGIRVLALLPQHWRKDLRNAAGDVVIRVQVAEGVTSAAVRDEAAAALAESGTGQWELVACETLVLGPGRRPT